jgi:hypothetical protein
MAKELPYFQFEPAVYLTGSIQFCSLEAQGLFNNICCIYWQRSCQLTIEQLNKKFDKKDLINELIKEKIIKVDGESVIIDFLVKQFEEITNSKSILSRAGRKGGLSSAKARLQASVKHKIREDEIIGDNTKLELPKLTTVEQYCQDLYNSQYLETISKQNNLTIEQVREYIPKFKPNLEYPTFVKYAEHFSRWLALILKSKSDNKIPKRPQLL